MWAIRLPTSTPRTLRPSAQNGTHDARNRVPADKNRDRVAGEGVINAKPRVTHATRHRRGGRCVWRLYFVRSVPALPQRPCTPRTLPRLTGLGKRHPEGCQESHDQVRRATTDDRRWTRLSITMHPTASASRIDEHFEKGLREQIENVNWSTDLSRTGRDPARTQLR